MSNDDYPYPEDEFDTLGAQRAITGVHREPKSRLAQWIPYLLVIVLVPLLTFAVVKFYSSGSTPAPEASPTESVSPDAGDEGEGADGNGPGQSEDGEAEQDPEDSDESGEADGETVTLDRGILVRVLNGARIQGLAGQVAGILETDGWTNTDPDNYTHTSPVSTVLYYHSAEVAGEAEAIASTLGIPTVVEDGALAAEGIVIVLRAEFTLP